MMTIEGCPICKDTTVVKLPANWGDLVHQDESIPLIACGNPWHYANITYDEPIWKWLTSTYELQTQTYGYDLDWFIGGLATGARSVTKELAAYIMWNAFSAAQELAEMNVEYSWKPWAIDEPFVNRERIVNEAVDVLHFIGNILTGMGVTDEEFWAAYRTKQQKNRERAASGSYSAIKGGLGEGSDL